MHVNQHLAFSPKPSIILIYKQGIPWRYLSAPLHLYLPASLFQEELSRSHIILLVGGRGGREEEEKLKRKKKKKSPHNKTANAAGDFAT